MQFVDTTYLEETIQHFNSIEAAILPTLQQLTLDVRDYIGFLKQHALNVESTGSYHQQITSCENVLDKMMEIVDRKNVLNQKGVSLLNILNGMKTRVESIVNESGKEMSVEETHDKVILKLIELKQAQCDQEKKELESQLLVLKVNHQPNPSIPPITPITPMKPTDLSQLLTSEEQSQLEEWTSKKCGEVLFDSDTDDWDDQTVINERLFRKECLMLIVEDTKGNKFGGYLEEELDAIYSFGQSDSVYDPKSFLFTLKSKGRIDGMKRYMKKQGSSSNVRLFKPGQGWWPLIDFGGDDLKIGKKSDCERSTSTRRFNDYESDSIDYPLCGKGRFTPKRFVFIHMQ